MLGLSALILSNIQQKKESLIFSNCKKENTALGLKLS